MEASSELIGFLEDAKRFLITSRHIIDRAPLQIYGCALAFLPANNSIKKLCWEQRLPYIKRIVSRDSPVVSSEQDLPAAGESRVATFSQNGQTLASSSLDTLQLWDIEAGALQKSVDGYKDGVWSIAFSMDDSMIAVGFGIGMIDVWNTRTDSHRTLTLESHRKGSLSIAFSADCTRLATTSRRFNTVQLWDLETDTYQFLDGHTAPVNSIRFSARGQLASGGRDGSIRLWSDKSGAFQKTLAGTFDEAGAIRFSHDGTRLASAVNLFREIWIWKVDSDAAPETIEPRAGKVAAIAFSKDDGTLVSICEDSTLRLWKLSAGPLQQIGIMSCRCAGAVSVAFSADCLRLAVAVADGVRFTLQTTEVKLIPQSADYARPVAAVTISRDGATIAFSASDLIVRLWSTATGSPIRTLEPRECYVAGFEFSIALKFSVDGTMLAGTYRNEVIWVWNLNSNDRSFKLDHSSDSDHRIRWLEFSPDNNLLVTCHDVGLEVWSLEERAPKYTCEGYGFDSMLFSADSKIFATSSEEAVWVRSADSGKLLKKFAWIGSPFSFSENNSSLTTDVGTYALEPDAEMTEDAFTHHPYLKLNLPLLVEDNWIVRGEKGLLWLPPEYRPTFGTTYAINENTIVLGHKSRHVTIIEFDPEAEDGVDVDEFGRRLGIDDGGSGLSSMSLRASSSGSDISSEERHVGLISSESESDSEEGEHGEEDQGEEDQSSQ